MLTINPQSSIMWNFINDNSLKLTDHGVTHISKDGTIHIDLCIVDANDVVSNSGKSDQIFIQYHFLINVTLKLFFPSPTANEFSFHKLNKINKLDFTSFLLTYKWESMYNLNSVESILLLIEIRIREALDKFAPKITISPKNRPEPCITPDLSQLQGECLRLYTKDVPRLRD